MLPEEIQSDLQKQQLFNLFFLKKLTKQKQINKLSWVGLEYSNWFFKMKQQQAMGQELPGVHTSGHTQAL